jgi:hypothetical protein
MSDNFGSGQNRVLNVDNRSLDNIVFQYKRPPLTSEWNLINQIGNEKIQNITKVMLPSGWLSVEDIKQDVSENDIQTGEVLCSNNFTIDSSFKLFTRGNNIAIVNGWPILIQGSTSFNNISISIGDYSSTKFNFVFLEVWRKLVGSEDNIYKYGNTDAGAYSDNEIEWDAIGLETTKRVQLQYKIRVVDPVDEMNPFDGIHPTIGDTSSEATLLNYSVYGMHDGGLYIAGTGSSSDQTYLDTVDGYKYAIPMFIVYRRIPDSDFGATGIHNSKVSKNMSTQGYRSDRPDDKLSNIVYAEDIIDLRNRVIASQSDLEDIFNKSVDKLISGDLHTKGYIEGGTISYSSGGNTILRVERINGPSGTIPKLGNGSDIVSTYFKRRTFCNSEINQDHNVVEIPRPGSTWASGDTITIASVITFPDGELISVDGFYSDDASTKIVTGVTSDGVIITIGASSSLVGTSNTLLMEFTFKYSSSSYGFDVVPKEFLEISKNDQTIIATRDNDVYLKKNLLGTLPKFVSGVDESDGITNILDRVSYQGGNYTDNIMFGHDLILNRTTTASSKVYLTLDSSNKYAGYNILGIKSVTLSNSPSTYVGFTVKRNLSTLSPYIIQDYEITITGYPNEDMIINCYTGSGIEDTYSISNAVKFFELSKQGRGVIDTYEMIEIIAERVSTNTYEIKTDGKPIIALATRASTGVLYNATCFGYSTNSLTESLVIDIIPPTNSSFPVLEDSDYTEDNLPTVVTITTTSYDDLTLRVPVFVHSYVTQNESPYNFYFKTIPYQGLLTSSSSIYGKIETEGKAVITTLGSGAIDNITYSEGEIDLVSGTRTVSGTNTSWLSFAESGDVIGFDTSPLYYQILSVDSDTQLTLVETYDYPSIIAEDDYRIIKMDTASSIISNVVDRLPTLRETVSNKDLTDYNCYSDSLSGDNTLIITKPLMKLQDPLLTYINDFKLGNNGSAFRGRNDIRLTINGNDLYKIGLFRPYIVYEDTGTVRNKKVYQFYLFNKSGKGGSDPSLSGKLYLMVVSGEAVDQTANSLNPYTDRDTVDIFELVGRPIVK